MLARLNFSIIVEPVGAICKYQSYIIMLPYIETSLSLYNRDNINNKNNEDIFLDKKSLDGFKQ